MAKLSPTATACVAVLNRYLGSDDARHRFLTSMFGVDSIKALDETQLDMLHTWLSPVYDTGTRSYAISGTARAHLASFAPFAKPLVKAPAPTTAPAPSLLSDIEQMLIEGTVEFEHIEPSMIVTEFQSLRARANAIKLRGAAAGDEEPFLV